MELFKFLHYANELLFTVTYSLVHVYNQDNEKNISKWDEKKSNKWIYIYIQLLKGVTYKQASDRKLVAQDGIGISLCFDQKS